MPNATSVLRSRREFARGGVVLLGGALLARCGRLPFQAQPSRKVPKIGFLSGGAPGPSAALVDAFQEGLRDLGYVEGQTIISEYRYAEGQAGRLPDLAAELVDLPVDLIVTAGGEPAARAAKGRTSTIPIVMAVSNDPVGTGLVASIAHPGANVTGLSNIGPELAGKRLQLLKEAYPSASRVAAIWNSVDGGMALEYGETLVGAEVLGIEVQSLAVREPGDLERVFGALSSSGIDALVVIADGFTIGNRAQLVELAAKSQLPTISGDRAYAAAGGLMSYGPSYPEMYRRAAYYVDRILKGAKPTDLPVEQPMRFDFAINLRTAQALGLTIPQHVLLQATEVIR